jgi:ribose transport system ATP-binding protein
VRTLSVGAQQLVEIARALVIRPQVIVFDEPTSSLPRQDVARLFEVIRGLRRAGLGIIYISHFLEEVREVADDFSVLRDGETVGGGELAGVTDAQVVALMAGRSVDELFPQVPHQVGPPLLEIDQLSGRRLPKHVSLTLHRGEILGISGLVGAGRTELLRCLLGLDPVRSGSVRLAGRPLGGALRQRLRAGLGLVSEDRKNEGLAQGLSLADNLTLSRLEPYSRLGWLRLGRRRAAVRDWIRRLEIKARDGEQPVHTLSGGNQQKVALARLLHQDADVLLLDEPTRGIDVGTKSAIYRLMGDWAARGKAIIFVSSYLPELLSVCDRVAVLARGQLRAVRPARDWTEHEILAVAVAADTQ